MVNFRTYLTLKLIYVHLIAETSWNMEFTELFIHTFHHNIALFRHFWKNFVLFHNIAYALIAILELRAVNQNMKIFYTLLLKLSLIFLNIWILELAFAIEIKNVTQ